MKKGPCFEFSNSVIHYLSKTQGNVKTSSFQEHIIRRLSTGLLKPDKIIFMVLTLTKIQHRGAYRIGIRFPYAVEVTQKLKSLGAVYSATRRCRYMDYRAANYKLLQSGFDELVIENPKPEHTKADLVASPADRDLPPIVAPGKTIPEATKLPGKENEKPVRGHKADIVPLAQKLRLHYRALYRGFRVGL
jgi:hypothetical protein